MDMEGGTEVPEWFVNLPLSDPRCKNNSCAAFEVARTASQTQISWASQFEYGKYTTWFYIGVLGLFVIARLYHLWVGRKPHFASPAFINRLKAVVRYVSYRRISGPLGIYFGLPSAGILLIIFVSFVASVAMSFAQRPYYRESRLYGSPPLAVRTGLMSAALIPLIIALAGKVNIVTMLTGIGHEKLNALHRWVGWIMFFLSTVHTIPFFLQEGREGLLQTQFFAEGSLEYNGTPTYAIGFFLVAFSLPFIRRKFYEAFAFSHIIGAIVFFALCFWHFGNYLDSWHYLWGALAVWLIQLLGRVFWKTSAFKVTENWFEGLPTVAHRLPGDMAKLEVFVPREWTWQPGQHVFLRFPHLNPLDNHPFTIASIPNRGSSDEKQAGNIMTFLVRAQTGSTKKLLSWLEKTPDAKVSTIVDGPYGTVCRRYENCAEEVILVAGGNGISACLPYLQYLSKIMQQRSCTTTRVKLLWIVRYHDHVAWVAEELHRVMREASEGNISIDLYVTNESAKGQDIPEETREDKKLAEDTISSSAASELQAEGMQRHFSGRPNLVQLLPQLVSASSTAIIACGPESLKIDVSNTVARLQSRVIRGEAAEISLHTETFDW